MPPEFASTPTTLPPRLKLWAIATQWLLALLLSCALLLGLGWALLHWLIVPRIDEFRPALERLARQATGLQINHRLMYLQVELQQEQTAYTQMST